ncbi:MAG: methylmalonyl Co-A mutase-associated GTPase MeaB [Candidatus Hatepunaea meridiana]|nr:methylmalonyl Co-A mutase-associated GTPase MeaB [Candidatus Hatepunaea meridiana]
MNSQRRLELSRLLSKLDRLAPADTLPSVGENQLTGKAFRIGITGPLGAGKSTLINEIARIYRKYEKTIGILAVDPTSPFTGGAVLGDRVRMHDLTLDDGIFIRSLATRGASGGLTVGAIDATDMMDTFNFDRIIIETVGVGQAEVDIVGACDVTVVVLEPGGGDGIQAMKAGLMEIADLFVVNKKDMKGADRFVMELESVLEMKGHGKRPDVLTTSANNNEGIVELVEWLDKYYMMSTNSGELIKRRAGQRIIRIRRAAELQVVRKMWDTLSEVTVNNISKSEIPVRQAAYRLVEQFVIRKQ